MKEEEDFSEEQMANISSIFQSLCEDSMFPLKHSDSIMVHVSFPLDGQKKIDIRPWTAQDEAKRTHQDIQDIEA